MAKDFVVMLPRPKVKQDLFVVASHTAMRAYTPKAAEGKNQKFNLLFELKNPEGRLHSRELSEDRPGRSYKSSSRFFSSIRTGATGKTTHIMSRRKTPQQINLESFSLKIAKYLNKKRIESGWKIFLFAEPGFLGHIKTAMRGNFSKTVRKVIGKDLMKLPFTDLCRTLQKSA